MLGWQDMGFRIEAFEPPAFRLLWLGRRMKHLNLNCASTDLAGRIHVPSFIPTAKCKPEVSLIYFGTPPTFPGASCEGGVGSRPCRFH